MKRYREESGIALILVLWVMVMLTAIVGEFAFSMRTELNIARNFKEEETAYQLAVAGVEKARAEILAAQENVYPFFNKNGVLVFTTAQLEENPDRQVLFKGGMFTYTIIDEDGKININTASPEQLRHITSSMEIDSTDVDIIVDSILDWQDTDNLHRLNGAEEEYYQSLPEPYSCKDNKLMVIEELLLVKGVSQKLFYGSPGEQGQTEQKALSRYLAVRDSSSVNINTAPKIVLEAILGANEAENIVNQRVTAPMASPVANGIIRSVLFTIISTGTSADGKIKRSVKTVVKRNGDKLETIYWNDNWTERQSV